MKDINLLPDNYKYSIRERKIFIKVVASLVITFFILYLLFRFISNLKEDYKIKILEINQNISKNNDPKLKELKTELSKYSEQNQILKEISKEYILDNQNYSKILDFFNMLENDKLSIKSININNKESKIEVRMSITEEEIFKSIYNRLELSKLFSRVELREFTRYYANNNIDVLIELGDKIDENTNKK